MTRASTPRRFTVGPLHAPRPEGRLPNGDSCPVCSHSSGAVLRQDVTLATASIGGPHFELGGIGAALRQGPDGIAFGELFAGDPASRAGLRPGDRILPESTVSPLKGYR